MGAGTPAVITGDPHLPCAQLQHRIVHRRKLIAMGRVLNFMGRPGQGGEFSSVQPQLQPLALCVGDLRPADAGPVAAFLGKQVGRQVLFRAVVPDPEAGAFPPVMPNSGISPSSFTGS